MVTSAMRIIADGGSDGMLDLQPEDYKTLLQATPWLAHERARARRGLQAACFGTLDATGLTPFQLPAEYVAAAIVMFVKPVNYMIACHEMSHQARTSVTELASEFEEGLEPMKPEQLFALCVQASAHSPTFKAQFTKRTNRKLEQAADA